MAFTLWSSRILFFSSVGEACRLRAGCSCCSYPNPARTHTHTHTDHTYIYIFTSLRSPIHTHPNANMTASCSVSSPLPCKTQSLPTLSMQPREIPMLPYRCLGGLRRFRPPRPPPRLRSSQWGQSLNRNGRQCTRANFLLMLWE